MTDTLTRALAAVTAASALDTGWYTEAVVGGLAPVARHAVETGHRMYCFWYV